MEIILHAGPMKTGSSFLQDCMKLNRAELLQFGIAYQHLRVVEQPDTRGTAFLHAKVLEQRDRGCRKLLLSSELMARFDNTRWSLNSDIKGLRKRAVLIHRPLTELYVSLYLQGFKGPRTRTWGFPKYVRSQIAVDRAPQENRGQTFNFDFLDAKLKSEGFETTWVRYDRDSLLDDFFAAVDAEHGTELARIVRASLDRLRPPPPLSPRRSLKMCYAPIARNINRLVRNGRISAEDRERLLSLLLDLSETVDLPNAAAIPAGLAAEIAALDAEINGAFYRRIAAGPSARALQEQKT